MPERQYLPGDYLTPVNRTDESTGDKLRREVELLGAGAGSFTKAIETAVTDDKLATAAKVVSAVGIGGVLSVLSKGTSLTGIATRAVIAGLGVATVADVAPKAFEVGSAFSDNWKSDANWQKNKQTVEATMGPFLADAAILTAAGLAGDRVGARFRTMVEPKIPPFRYDGHLPNGVHPASWNEFSARFGVNEHRQGLLDGMKVGLNELRARGVKKAYVGGSFVTTKELPRDFDITFDATMPQMKRWLTDAPILTNVAEQETRFGGSFMPSFKFSKDGGQKSFYQTNRYGRSVGILELDLRTLPRGIERFTDAVAPGGNWWNTTTIGMPKGWAMPSW